MNVYERSPECSAVVGQYSARTRRRAAAFRYNELVTILLVGDVLVTAIASWAAPAVWARFDKGFIWNPYIQLWQVASTLLWPVLLRLLGAGDIASARFLRRSAAALVQTFIWLVAGVVGVFYLAPFFAPRGATLLSLVLAASLLFAWRGVFSVLSSHELSRRNLGILGVDDATARLVNVIAAGDARPYRLAAVFTSDVGTSAQIPAERLLPASEDLWQTVQGADIDQLVIGRAATLSSSLQRELAKCFEAGIELVPAVRLYEELTGRVMASALEPDWYAALPTHARGPYAVAKMSIDTIAAALLLVILLPAIILIGMAIVLDSGMPVIYRQVRVGKRGEPFVLHKFRSMVIGAEGEGPLWASTHDERVTRLGRLLRRTRFDELPQLWDVLRGKMSLIGPRPERPEFAARLSDELPLYRAREVVRPGITGWAQVRFPYAGSVEANLAKLEYDLYYIRHLTPLLDAAVAVRTIGVILGLRGR